MSAGTKGTTHRQKVDRLIATLSKQGISRYTVAPPLFRILWAFGLDVPPPFFLGFLTLTLLMGPFFGILWGAIMWAILWQAWHMSLELAVLIAAGAGLAFGLSMATYYRWKAVSLQLPPWENYPGD